MLRTNSSLEALVDTDLDTLATAIYVSTDDLLKARPELVPWRPAVGMKPQVSKTAPSSRRTMVREDSVWLAVALMGGLGGS